MRGMIFAVGISTHPYQIEKEAVGTVYLRNNGH